MKINIELEKKDIDNLLKKYGYRQGKVIVYYNLNGDDKDIFTKDDDGVHHYFVDVAWDENEDKPQCLCEDIPTMEAIKEYTLENVVNKLFIDSLLKVIF